MFVLDQLTILSEVNLLLVQGLVEASWNEDATVFLLPMVSIFNIMFLVGM